jgi:hypothetical protein
MQVVSVVLSILLSLHQAAGKPPHEDSAAVARWQLAQANWGVLATTSVHLNGTAFGNPISVADPLGDGIPYFYVSGMDVSMQDVAKDPRCTLTLSEASIDCQSVQLDPEDPRCVRLSLSGALAKVTDEAETSKAKEGLFKRHPVMKSWPADHGFYVAKLEIQHIWLIGYFGGAADVPIADYTAAKASAELVPINAGHVPTKGKPFFQRKAATARWLVHESTWGSIATTSVHLNGTAFGNPISLTDGTAKKSTGIPYFFVSDLDTSVQDLKQNPQCTLTLSEASVDCVQKKLDPEDPRCVRLSLTGKMVDVTDTEEKKFAKEALFAKHPVMASWPESHDFKFTKLNIEHIWLINFFGGASNISPKDYFAVKSVSSIAFV